MDIDKKLKINDFWELLCHRLQDYYVPLGYLVRCIYGLGSKAISYVHCGYIMKKKESSICGYANQFLWIFMKKIGWKWTELFMITRCFCQLLPDCLSLILSFFVFWLTIPWQHNSGNVTIIRFLTTRYVIFEILASYSLPQFRLS